MKDITKKYNEKWSLILSSVDKYANDDFLAFYAYHRLNRYPNKTGLR